MLRHCLEADREHGENRRQYAHTFHYPDTICLAEAFWTLPKKYRDGIVLHEMGHLLSGVEASEAAANDAVEDKTGARIEYVDSKYGPNLERAGGDVRPRLSFDSVSGRGSAGLPVAVNPAPVRCPVCGQAVGLNQLYTRLIGGEHELRFHYYPGTFDECPGSRKTLTEAKRLKDSRPNVTDRALRYRANELPPEGPRVCSYCGSLRFVEIDHVNGFEDDTSPENLTWACRRCNTLKGIAFRNAGRGRRTAQYNPTKSGGAATVGEWIRAVGSIIPHRGAQYAGANYGLAEAMPVGEAVAMIRATPQYKRSEYASQLRKHRGGRRRAEEVPF